MAFVLIAILLATWCSMLILGTGGLDRALLIALNLGQQPDLRSFAVAITTLGGWAFLLTITAGAMIVLVLQRRLAAAVLLACSTATGRLFVELQKWTFERPRPEGHLRLVDVNSYAFPSGHAANSMIAFVMLALLFSENKTRLPLIAFAVALSVAVGISRILLGVHWPSDVVAGWAFGLLWVFAFTEPSRRI